MIEQSAVDSRDLRLVRVTERARWRRDEEREISELADEEVTVVRYRAVESVRWAVQSSQGQGQKKSQTFGVRPGLGEAVWSRPPKNSGYRVHLAPGSWDL